MEIEFHSAMTTIDSQQWDALWPTDYPFIKHCFLLALEQSGSVDGAAQAANANIQDSGWQSRHLTISIDGTLIGAMPLYEKYHSYGEYVFDWSWAEAYGRAGLNYYPKLINAIPFTPSIGPRMGLSQELSEEKKRHCAALLLEKAHEYAVKHHMSGFHSLFPDAQSSTHCAAAKLQQRSGYQFHWFNSGFTNFDNFLENFNSRKRKNLKKERKKVDEQGITMRVREAGELNDNDWNIFYGLYHRTYLKRSGRAGYLGSDFFHRLGHAMPTQVLLISAHQTIDGMADENFVGAALYLRDEHTLYGRYWGTKVDLDCIHFEACYYQGIEYAIKHGLQRFDPGAQGEHKIQRGFTPIKTYSYHHLTHPDFNHAITEFLHHEDAQVDSHINDTRTFLPFKEGTEIVPINYLAF
ncbi:MAG: putative N-acyltransferase [Lentisphaeria bacterium]|jgi:predicted N-acyltransferase